MPPRTAIPISRRAVQRGVPVPIRPLLLAPLSTLSSATSRRGHPPTSHHRLRLQPQPQPQLQLQPPLHTRPLHTEVAPSQRTVLIHVKPPPQTLAERRSVLRVIERHGKTDLFKKTASNDSFLCIASTTDMADALLKKSPFSYDIADSLATVPFSLSSRLASRALTSPASGSDRTFTVSVFPAASYPHRTTIRNGPLYGPWPDDIEPMLATSPSFKNTFTYNALRGVVPESASADALCDWRPRIAFATGVSNAPEDADRDKESRRAVQSHDSKVARIRDRRVRRSHAQRSVLSRLVGR